MSGSSRSVRGQDEWPFVPWPARSHALYDWNRGTAPRRAAPRRWRSAAGLGAIAFAALGALAVAGVAAVQLRAGDTGVDARKENASPAGRSPAEDRRLGTLMREHQRAVRGL